MQERYGGMMEEFPTPVGMARSLPAPGALRVGVSHACGDGPQFDYMPLLAWRSSPRLWGWPAAEHGQAQLPGEFPTPVGMARLGALGLPALARVPHACGDGPLEQGMDGITSVSSPRL